MDTMWRVACSDCDWQYFSFKEYRAENWAEDHADEHGHKTTAATEVPA
jgi:hypothetical protein